MKKSENVNQSGLEIIENWQDRARAAGSSLHAVCGKVEAAMKENGHKIRSGGVFAMTNVWRFSPPAALLLVHKLYNEFILSYNTPAEAFGKLNDFYSETTWNRDPLAFEYFIEIEKSILMIEAGE